MDNFSTPQQQPPRRAPRAATTLNQHLAVLGRQLSAVFADWAVRMETADPIHPPAPDPTPQNENEHGSPADIASPDAHLGHAQRDATPSLPDTVTITIDAEDAEVRESVEVVDEARHDGFAEADHDNPGSDAQRELEREAVTEQMMGPEVEAEQDPEPEPGREHQHEHQHEHEHGHETGHETGHENEPEHEHEPGHEFGHVHEPGRGQDLEDDLKRVSQRVLQPEQQSELTLGLQPPTRAEIWPEGRPKVSSGLQPEQGPEAPPVGEQGQARDLGRRRGAKAAERGAGTEWHSGSEHGETDKRTRSWTPEEEGTGSDDGDGGSAGRDEIAGREPGADPRAGGSDKPKRKRRRYNWTADENDVFMRTVRENPGLRGMALINCVGDALGGKRSASQIRRRFRTLRGNGTIEYRVTRSVEWGQPDGPVEHRHPGGPT